MTPRSAMTVVIAFGVLGVAGCGRPSGPAAMPAPPATKQAAAPRPPAAAPASQGQTGAPVEVAQTRATPAPPALRIVPEEAMLTPGDPGLQWIVEEDGARGGRRDATAEARWEAEPKGVVAVGPGGYVLPVGPGRATVQARVGDGRAEAVVTVAEGADRPWDFAADVVPILTRAGCNTGGCHGRADGQNGFHLSLFGYDPEADHRALTREAGGRRLLPFDPAESLLLRKATGRTPHGGGRRIAADSTEFRTLRDWIAAGAPERRGTTHGALVNVTVEPANVLLDEPGPQQVRVVARYADGHARDVTRLANFRVLDDSAAAIDSNGKAILLRRAETDLVVRYQSTVVTTRLATVINPDLSFDFAALPRRNVIDVELFKRLEALRVPPSPPASDAAFLRRASLDLTGQQPRPEQVRQFLKDTDTDKRAKLVDRLLADADFVQFWQIKLGDLLQISAARFGNGAGPYQYWLKTRLMENAPWDAMIRELLTALGDPTVLKEGGAINYALDGPDAKVQAEQTAQRFLGLRFRCAQCHDHPFDVWTQDDYFGLAAFFAKVRRGAAGSGGMMGRARVEVDPKGQIEHLRTKRPAEPRLPGGETVALAEGDDPRRALAEWMTRPDNPFFARAAANWVWAQFFGKGIADPADDLSRSNPPVHPELLDALARLFVEHKYDLRDLIRTVATSEAYGLSSAPVPGNAHDHRLFSHQTARPLTAHQMVDALAQATDVPDRYASGKGLRAIEITDPGTPSAILDTFGRCPRTNGCAAVVTPSLSLRQALLTIGGDVIEKKVAHLNGYLSNLLTLNPEPAEVIENLYYRTLCRPPTVAELDHWAAALTQAPAIQEAAEDLFWALLNSREFAFNH
jgi:hypothetical protein